MEKTVRLNADQREDLVAYLDGELPDDQVQQIDNVISRSEVARHEVEALARAWEMLDVLTPMPASEDFATKTLSSLRALEQPFIISDQWWYIYITRSIAVTGWLAAVSLCGWLGFQITRHWVPNPNDALIRDMPVIEKLHEYQDVGDIEFLKELKRQGLFDEAPEK